MRWPRSWSGNYRDMFGDRSPEYPAILRSSAKLVIERIANSDALYHDAQHTVMVTLVGQAMLRGRVLAEKVTGRRLAALHGGDCSATTSAICAASARATPRAAS